MQFANSIELLKACRSLVSAVNSNQKRIPVFYGIIHSRSAPLVTDMPIFNILFTPLCLLINHKSKNYETMEDWFHEIIEFFYEKME